MKRLSLCLIISAISFSAIAQTDFKKNVIYVEAAGNGLFASVNYERQLSNEPGFGLRAGLGFYSEKAFYLTIPVGINYLFNLKNNKSFIDAGLGVTFTRIDANLFGPIKNRKQESFINFVPSVGYRKHTDKNVVWRISFTPIANYSGLIPWLGFSVGKRF